MDYKNTLKNAKAMIEAPAKGIGPDIVIIVSSSEEQSDFWQGRLTGEDGLHGSGDILKTDAIVLSVTESNWKGGAGNGLGTLNGFLQAARKACETGVLECGDTSIKGLTDALTGFCRDRSVFMYHTAGKGTRTAPLPGAECNSKPLIKLPRMISCGSKSVPMTMLEAAIVSTSIYAPSRQGRLGVFWGDQVIINEGDVGFKGKHHIESFGQMVELEEDIKSYGILIPGRNNDCKVREKLSMDEVQAILPAGEDRVLRNVGSFTISLQFLNALIGTDEDIEFLEREEGESNVDPDWWQPLTSGREEYAELMRAKGVSYEEALKHWDVMDAFWKEFSSGEGYTENGLSRELGFVDVGKNAIWWDYGQNSYYLKNMLILAGDTGESVVARAFFGIPEDGWQDADSDTGNAEVTHSVIQCSTIGKGKLENCVVIGSAIGEITAKNAVIIGSVLLQLFASDALCYNVVEKEASLSGGDVLANVFHPEKGRISMRTNISRDGRDDWNANAKVCSNSFTYKEIHDLMNNVRVEDVERVKAEAIKKVKG